MPKIAELLANPSSLTTEAIRRAQVESAIDKLTATKMQAEFKIARYLDIRKSDSEVTVYINLRDELNNRISEVKECVEKEQVIEAYERLKAWGVIQ